MVDAVRAAPAELRRLRWEDEERVAWDETLRGERFVEAMVSQEVGRTEFLVLARGEEVLGTLVVDFTQGRFWQLAVRPDHRRRGLALGLMRVGESKLLESGWQRAELLVRLDNRGARKLYASLGYRLSGTEMVDWEVGGRVVSARCARLRKELGE